MTTTSLLHFDDSYLDSTRKRIWTVHGNVSIVTSNKKIGTGSMYTNSAVLTSYISTPLVGELLFNKIFPIDLFSVECWFRRDGNSSLGIFGFGVTAGMTCIASHINNKVNCSIRINDTYYTLESSSLVNGDVWAHVLITRNYENNFSLYLNGIEEDSVIVGEYPIYGLDGHNLSVGGLGEAGIVGSKGYIDEFRVVTGAGVTSNFTPQTTPYKIFFPKTTIIGE